MKKLIFILFFSTFCIAEIPISNLPSFTGSQVGSIDTVPFVNFATNTTGQLPFSQFFLIPSLQSPTFTGTLSVPTCVFDSVTATKTLSVPTGTFTTGIRVQGVATIGTSPVQHNLSTVSAAFANCGSLAGATGCIKLNLNGQIRYIPYF
jgi:hypothetical protein